MLWEEEEDLNYFDILGCHIFKIVSQILFS